MKIIKRFKQGTDVVKLHYSTSTGNVYLSFVNKDGCAINGETPEYTERTKGLRLKAQRYCANESLKLIQVQYNR